MQLIQLTPPLVKIRLRIVPQLPGLLSLMKCLLDTTDQADVLVDCIGEGERILLGLPGVEVADAQLDVGEGGEGPC